MPIDFISRFRSPNLCLLHTGCGSPVSRLCRGLLYLWNRDSASRRSGQWFRREPEIQCGVQDGDPPFSIRFVLYSFSPTAQSLTCYGSGLGLFIAPFVSTQFAQIPRWSFHFLVSLGLSLSNVALQLAVFRLGSLDGNPLRFYNEYTVVIFIR